MIATNAGGIHVVRYGTMRAQVAGIEAVLGDGSVVSHLAGLAKDNTGYDLAGLLTGSEGTLAVITAARLRLVPRLEHRVTAGLGLAGVAEAVDAVARLRARLAGLEAVELVLADGVRLVAEQLGLRPPDALRAPAALIVEVGGHDDPVEELAAAVAELDLVEEPVVAVTPEQRRRLWELRESFAEAINRLGPPVKLDVSVPAGAHGGVRGLAARRRARRARGRRVRPPRRRQPPRQRHGGARRATPGWRRPSSEAVLEAVVAEGGSISAEHGIGTAKAAYLHLCRSPAEIAAFRAVKSALDPHGILNPHALLARSTVRIGPDLDERDRPDRGHRSSSPSLSLRSAHPGPR